MFGRLHAGNVWNCELILTEFYHLFTYILSQIQDKKFSKEGFMAVASMVNPVFKNKIQFLLHKILITGRW